MTTMDWTFRDTHASPTMVAAPQHPPNRFTPIDSPYASKSALVPSAPWLADAPKTQNQFHYNPNLTQADQPRTSYAFAGHNFFMPAFRPPSPPKMAVAGRKRSRDEISEAIDDVRAPSSTSSMSAPSPPKPKSEPIYGPGMTLVYPDDPSYNALNEASQTGTWAEELIERMRSSSFNEQPVKRPALDSRKSLRLGNDAPGLDDVAAAIASESAQRGASAEEPTIDEASIALGIGWSSMPSTMDSACRGWSRHIEHHFPLRNVKIVWSNKAMPAYLVGAVSCDFPGRTGASGYYLFDEELTQGRMIARSWERALDNLRQTPMQFDGEEVMSANHETPSTQPQAQAGTTMGQQGTEGTEVDGMEID